jgi:hypothetical protein
MSVSHCMHEATRIAQGHRDGWAEQIALLPASCAHADCGMPRNCRERIADYLRTQYRIQVRLELTGGRRR